jgi:superfamily II DNA or RNA helicase
MAEQNGYKRHIVNNDERTQFIIDAVCQRVVGNCLPGIIFVKEKLHGAITHRALTECLSLGHRHNMTQVAYVTADVPKKQRQQLAEDMRNGELQVAVATSVWATGLDIPNLRWVMWAGGGQAPIGFLQARGRGSRIAGGKDDFELIIIEDKGLPNHEVQSRKRLEHLRKAGMISDEEFLQSLEALPPSEPEDDRIPWREVSLPRLLFHPCSPWSWLFYGTIFAALGFTCNLLEKMQ